MRVTNALLILVGSGLVLVGCEGMGMFGPSGIDMLEERIGGIADAQGGLSSFVESGNTAMQEQLDKMTASLETINFRTEEDRKGAMGMIATVQATFDEFKGSVAEHATSVDEKVGKLWDDAKELREAETPGEALTAVGRLLVPFLGPYAPAGELVLGLLGIGVGVRRANKKIKSASVAGVKDGAQRVAGPIKRARRKDLEANLSVAENGSKFVVYDKAVATEGHGMNGIKAAWDSATEAVA